MTLSLLGKLDELERIVKHLPGRHDQKRHNPYKYGTLVTMQFLDRNPHWFRELEDFDIAAGTNSVAVVKSALVEYGVAQEDMFGLSKFTVDAPPGYDYGDDGKLHNIKDDYTVNGIYRNLSRTVVISADALIGDPDVVKRTVLHEMGHHVVFHKGIGERAVRERAARIVIQEAALKNMNSSQLAVAGLRPYSLTTPGEFLADTYMTMRAGTSDQASTLEDLWGLGGYTSLDKIFKELLEVMELQSKQVGEDAIEVVLVPASVSADVVSETPWYYVRGNV